jgi:CubicO group peptidase (beta-lactamase class C family)
MMDRSATGKTTYDATHFAADGRQRLLAMKRRNLLALLAAVPAAGVPRWPLAAVSIDGLRFAWNYSRQRANDSTVVVWQDGRQVFTAGNSDKVYKVASVTKSLTSIVAHAVGIPPGTPAHTLLPRTWVGGDERKRQITIGHLLPMTSGLEPHDNPAALPAAEYLSLLLGRRTTDTPGSPWAYASVPVDLLSIALQTHTGKTVRTLFNERVARKIGIPDVAWQSMGPYSCGSFGASFTARQLARVGQMLLNRGFLGSGRVLAPAQHAAMLSRDPWLQTAQFTPTPGTPFRIPQNQTSPQSYFRLVWSNRVGLLGPTVPRNVYFAWGFREQFLAIFPTEQLVVVRLGMGPTSDPSFRIEFFKRIVAAL